MRFFGPIASRKGIAWRYLQIQLIFNPLLVGGVTLALDRSSHLGRAFFLSLAVAAMVSSFCFGAVLLFGSLERRTLVALRRPVPKHSTGWYLLLSALVCPLGMFLAFGVMGLAAPRLGFPWQEPGPGTYRFGLLLGGLIMLVFFFWMTASEARDATQRMELQLREAETQRLQAQLAALAAQMNPHLIFNALNTVASLIASDPERAEETLLRLSDLYRRVLAAARKATHPLADELLLCQAYLDVEKARFGERLNASVDVADDLSPESVEVPVLLLQPLVENAVQHGLSGRAAGGSVVISARRVGARLELAVEDDGVGFGHSTRAGAGTSLSTCRERLRLRYQERAAFDIIPRPTGGTRVVLSFPLAE